MPSKAQPGAVKSGQAYVELYADDSKLVRGLKIAERKLKAFGKRVREIGQTTLALGASVAAPLALVGRKLTEIAGDAIEGNNRFRQVFGDMADEAEAFAQTLSKKVGRSVIETRDSLASFQGFFVGLGFDNGKALQLTQTVQQLATDFASFNNLTDAEGQERFIAALSGSSEVLDKFGINIKQAALGQELLREGVQGGVQAATEQQKALARLNIITRSMGDQGAVGDAARTSGSWANTLKRLRGQLLDTAAAIGRQLIPVLKPALDRLVSLVGATKAFVETHRPMVRALLKIGTAVAAVAGGAVVLGGALIVVGQAFIGLGAVLGLLTGPLKLALAAFGALPAILGAIVSPAGLVVAAIAGIGAAAVVVSGAGGKALAWLEDRFGELKTTATTALKGIKDALAAGDIKLAAKILWAGLQLAWAKGIQGLKTAWHNFNTYLTKVVFKAMAGVKILYFEAVNKIKNAWSRLTAFMADAWEKFLDYARPATKALAGLLVRVYGKLTGAKQEDIDQVIHATLDDNVDRELAKQKKKLAEVRDLAKKNIQANNEDLARAINAQASNLLEQLDGLQSNLDQLKKQFADLNKQAAKEAKDASGGKGGADRPSPVPDAGSLKDQISKIIGQITGGAAAAQQAHAQTVGGYDAAIVQRAFGDQPGTNIEQQQRNILQDLVNLLHSVPRYVQDIRDHLPAFE